MEAARVRPPPNHANTLELDLYSPRCDSTHDRDEDDGPDEGDDDAADEARRGAGQ
jgi:hypothetical protein